MSEVAENQRNAAFLARVTERRAALGISERELSLRVTGKPDLIRDLKRRGHLPDGEKLAAMAVIFGVSTDWLLGLDHSGDAAFPQLASDEARPRPHSAEEALTAVLPLVGAAGSTIAPFNMVDGETFDVEVSGFRPDEKLGPVRRPTSLMSPSSAFAFYHQGESMMPRFEPGEIGIADPSRPPRPGEYVVAQLEGNSSIRIALVKRLVSATATEVVLEQFDPAGIFKVPRERISRLFRVVPPSELL